MSMPRTVLFEDDFTSHTVPSCNGDGSVVGPWEVVFSGYGCVSVERDAHGAWLRIAPQVVSAPAATSAPLVVGPEFGAALDFSVRMNTEAQLRTGSAPNPWEVGWIVWHYTDPEHFYYFIAKPGGWELGKRDPAYPGGQRFLATGTDRGYATGTWHDVRIIHDGNRIAVQVNGTTLARIADRERPYVGGRIGLYSEDAAVRFSDVVVLSAATP